ncbi:MAG: hypothetical protein ACE5MI_14010, partial [Acidimicrobiia bacterium]
MPTDITVSVTGGVASTAYAFDVAVTDPEGAAHASPLGSFSFTTGPAGSGSALAPYPGAFSASPNTDFVGTYSMVADETAPGDIPGATSGSFRVGLTNLEVYERFDKVEIRSSGWAAGEEVTIDIKNSAGQSVTIGNSPYPADFVAASAVFNETDALPRDFPTGTYTVTVVNSTGTGTVKSPADIQNFDVVADNDIAVSVVAQPATSFERTEEATAKLSITYPDGSPFDPDSLGSISISVFNASAKIADLSLSSADFNALTASEWNATFKIPKGADLEAHNLTAEAGAVVDLDGNSGPSADVSSNDFDVVAAILDVEITGQWDAGDEFNRTAAVAMKLKVRYPDLSFYTPADLGSLAVNVTLVGVAFDIANLTLGASDFDAATNNWTAEWIIPFDAALSDAYNFRVRAGKVADEFGNDNTADSISNAFTVVEVTILVPEIATDRATYEREELVFVFFRGSYLDGSAVSTGSADLTLTDPAGDSAPLTATFSSVRNRFEASFFLTVLDPIGVWSVSMASFALTDDAGNDGPNVTRSTTFEVVRAVEVLQVEADAGSLHFRGEIAEFYVLTANRGAPIDVTFDAADLYRPDGLVEQLNAVRIAAGISRILYPIPADAPVGTYTLVVRVSAIFEQTEGKGVTIASFRISDTLSGFVVDISAGLARIETAQGEIVVDLAAINARLASIENGIANIETDVGLIQADLAAIRPVITQISSGVATIQTDVGELQVEVAALNPIVTEIQGDMATVKTDVGTLRGQVTGLEGDIALIQTNIGDIRADISGVADLSPAVSNILTVLYIVTALALIAALAA